MGKLTAANTAGRYETVIKEKAEELRRLCIQEEIPCFMAFGVTKDLEQTADESLDPDDMQGSKKNEYELEVIQTAIPEHLNLANLPEQEQDQEEPYQIKCIQAIPELIPNYLYDRRFSDFINIVNGFRAIPKFERNYMKMEMDIIPLPDVANHYHSDFLDDENIE